MNDRRVHRRYPLRLPVRYSVSEPYPPALSGVDFTQNLSSGGVALTSDAPLHIDRIINIWVSWSVKAVEFSNLELRMTGRVVRSNRTEIAIQVKRHDFVRVGRQRSEGDIAGRDEDRALCDAMVQDP